MMLRPASRTLIGALVLVVLVLALPASAWALDLQHGHVDVSVPGSTHGDVVWPGDSFAFSETIQNSDPTPVTGLHSLASAASPLTLTQDASDYPDIPARASQANSVPLQGTLAADAPCGARLPVDLHLATNQGSQSVPFSIPTGTPGPAVPYDSVDVPQTIPQIGPATSSFHVDAPGRVKDLRVRLGRIQHDYVGDLTISLIAPDGTSVLLVDQEGADGDNFVGTVFDDQAAASIHGAAAPFTGSFRPADPEGLAKLDGHPQQGTWTLKVVDNVDANGGEIDAWGADLSHAVCENRPVASLTATPNPAMPGDVVGFDASRSIDPGGTLVKYEWDLDGDGTYDRTTTGPMTSEAYPSSTSFQAHVRVTDSAGQTDVTSLPITVGAPPTAAITASSASPLTGEQVTLDATGSSAPGGSIARYEWDFDGDGTFDLTTSTPTTTTSYPRAGSVAPRVRVTTDTGRTALATLSPAIDVGNRPPVADFDWSGLVVAGSTPATFTSRSTDQDGQVVHYQWDLNQDGVFGGAGELDAASVQHAFARAGDYPVSLRAVDDAGGVSEPVTKVVHVVAPPTARIGATPNPATPGQVVTLDGLRSSAPSSSPSGIVKYEWDFEGDGIWDATGFDKGRLTHAYAVSGLYHVALRVTDAEGASDVTTLDVRVSGGLPRAAIAADRNPVAVGAPVTLSAAGSTDSTGHIERYDWDLDGNGSFERPTGASPSVSMTYPNPGVFPVTVRVTDDTGATAIATLDLTVSSPPSGGGGTAPPPVAGTTPPPPSGAGTPNGPGALAASLIGPSIQRIAAVDRRGLALGCRATRAGTCSVDAFLSARDARRLGLDRRARHPVLVGRAVVRLAAGRPAALRLGLSRRAHRVLRSRRLRSVVVALRATVVDPSGHRTVVRRVVLLRR